MATFFNKNLRFSIADADFYFKQMLIDTLVRNPFFKLVHNCNNGFELVNKIYRQEATVYLIDLYMPVMSGMEAIGFIRATDKNTPIITYSGTYQKDIHTILLQRNNIFYCQKTNNVILGILDNCILKSGNAYYEDYLQKWTRQPMMVKEYMERQKKGWYEPTLIEIQLMKLCYEGLSNKEIGQYLQLSPRTVDTYINRLTQKLGLRNKIDLIRFCVENGYYNSSY